MAFGFPSGICSQYLPVGQLRAGRIATISLPIDDRQTSAPGKPFVMAHAYRNGMDPSRSVAIRQQYPAIIQTHLVGSVHRVLSQATLVGCRVAVHSFKNSLFQERTIS